MIVIRYNIQTKKFRERLARIRTLPDMTRKGMKKWGEYLATTTKESALNAGIRPGSGYLFDKGIRWEQGSKSNVGELRIVDYGVALDEMKWHWVSIKRSRPGLLNWGLNHARSSVIRRNSLRIARQGKGSYGILVKNHPYIQMGWNIARPQLKSILKQSTRGI